MFLTKGGIMKKLAIIITNGFEEIEAVSVIDILRRAQIKVDVLALKDIQVTGAHDITIFADDIFNFYSDMNYDGILFAGGMANANSLAESDDVLKLIKYYNDNKKLIAAICASPALVLSKAGIIENKICTCYPDEGLISKIKNAKYIDKSVVVCDNIITSQSPFTAMAFALAIVNYFGYDVKKLQTDLKGK